MFEIKKKRKKKKWGEKKEREDIKVMRKKCIWLFWKGVEKENKKGKNLRKNNRISEKGLFGFNSITFVS